MARIRFGNRYYTLPGSKPVRIGIGVVLVLFGMFGFLPLIGFWMIPMGLLILSVDSFRIRRLRRRLEVWRGRRAAKRAARKQAATPPTPPTPTDTERPGD